MKGSYFYFFVFLIMAEIRVGMVHRDLLDQDPVGASSFALTHPIIIHPSHPPTLTSTHTPLTHTIKLPSIPKYPQTKHGNQISQIPWRTLDIFPNWQK